MPLMKHIFFEIPGLSPKDRQSAERKSRLPILRGSSASAERVDKKREAKNVAPIHASLEYNSVTRSYWLKDHSLTAHTTVNGNTVYGQIELNTGDLVCFGDSQPLVFENSTLVPVKHQVTADYHDMFLEKQASIDKVHFPALPRRQTPQSGGRGEALSSGREPPMRHDCLGGGAARKSRDTRVITGRHRQKEKRAGSADKVLQGNTSSRASSRSPRADTPPDSDSPQVNVYSTGPELRLTGNPTRIRSVGNHLLQRVIRLQSELARKDQEIRELRAGSTPMGIEQLSGYRSLLEQSEREKERLRDLLLQSSSSIPQPLSSPNPRYRPKIRSALSIDPDQFEDAMYASHPDQLQTLARTKMAEVEVYRAFVRTLAYELQSFNDRVLRQPVRDYSDVFQAIVRALEEPFSYKLMEIEADCEAYLTELGAAKEVTERLQHIVRDEKHHKISLLCNQLEVLLPVVRDAAAIARESIRVCAVFTQWSRQIGDEIRSRGLSAEILLEAIDSLKEQFAINRMGRHWLPPSLTPLLRVAALEIKKQKEENRNAELEKDLKKKGKQPGDSARQSNTDSESSLAPVKEEEVVIVSEKIPLTSVRQSDQELSSPELDMGDQMEMLKKHMEMAQFEKNEASIALEAEKDLTTSLQQEITELNSLVADREAEIANLNETVEDLMAQLDTVKREKSDIEKDVELLQERLQSAVDPLQRIKRTLSGLSNDDHGNGYTAEIEESPREEENGEEQRDPQDPESNEMSRLDPLGSSPCLINETILEEDEEGNQSQRSLRQVLPPVDPESEADLIQSEECEPESLPNKEIPSEMEELEETQEDDQNTVIENESAEQEFEEIQEKNENEGSARELAAPLVDEVLEKVQEEAEKHIDELNDERKISASSHLDCDLVERKKSSSTSADGVSLDSKATINSENDHHDLSALIEEPELIKIEEEIENVKTLHEQNSVSSEKTGTTAIYLGESQSFESAGTDETKKSGEEGNDGNHNGSIDILSPIKESPGLSTSHSQEGSNRSRISSQGYDPYDLTNTERREKRKASPDPEITKEEVEADEIVRILSARSTPPESDDEEKENRDSNNEVFSPQESEEEKEIPPEIEPLALRLSSRSGSEAEEESQEQYFQEPDAKAELQLLSDQVRELYNIKDNLEERLGAWNPDICYQGCDLTSGDLNAEMEAGEIEFKKVASYVFELLESDYEIENTGNEMKPDERRELRARVIERIVEHLHDLLRNDDQLEPELSPTAQQLGMYARGKKYNMIQDGPPPLMSDDDSFLEARTPKDARSVASRDGQRSPNTVEQSSTSTKPLPRAASLANTTPPLTAHMQSHRNTALGRPSREQLKISTTQFRWPSGDFYRQQEEKQTIRRENRRRARSNPSRVPYVQPRMRF